MEMILDTNALSAWVDGDEAIGKILNVATILVLNSISVGEYRFGLLSSCKRIEYEKRLSQIEADVPMLVIDAAAAVHYAAIRQELKRKGKPIPYHDIWIAALAQEHRLPVLSRDTHFDHVERVRRVGW
jgi:tRNA(fMet)-specific endonuclease VapC